MTTTLSGKCLCGSVQLEAQLAKASMGACHCNLCRRWSGGPMLTIDGGNKVKINGEENITRYESSEWAARAFCQNCGTHLYYQMNDTGQYYLPAGLFEGVEKLTFDHQIFIDQKPDNYAFANDTFNMTGEEVFAAFASQDGE